MVLLSLQHHVRSTLDAIVYGPRAIAPARWWLLPLTIALASGIYGVSMGSYDLSSSERLLMLPYAGVKVPLLFLVTTGICLPAYFVLSTILGLRGDFTRALSAIISGQAGTALALASLAPVIRFIYFGSVSHAQALIFSALMFSIATTAGYAVMLRRYRPLMQRNPRHRAMLLAWIIMYAFVGIQMGWMLRPFVGTPGIPVTFFRQEPFSNAYVAVSQIFLKSLRDH